MKFSVLYIGYPPLVDVLHTRICIRISLYAFERTEWWIVYQSNKQRIHTQTRTEINLKYTKINRIEECLCALYTPKNSTRCKLAVCACVPCACMCGSLSLSLLLTLFHLSICLFHFLMYVNTRTHYNSISGWWCMPKLFEGQWTLPHIWI